MKLPYAFYLSGDSTVAIDQKKADTVRLCLHYNLIADILAAAT